MCPTFDVYFRCETKQNPIILRSPLPTGSLTGPRTVLLAQKGYEIKVTFKPYTRGFIYLAHSFGKSIYVKDSMPLGPG